MILVDVYVPSIDKQYDFKLDENAFIADIVEELGEMLLMKDAEENDKIIKDLILCDFSSQKVLPLNQTLKQNGIGSGNRLVLI